MDNWDALKVEAKTLEQHIRGRLNNEPVVPVSRAPADPELGVLDVGAVRLREIEDSLDKFSEAVDRLGAAAAGGQASRLHVAQAQRFRDVLLELRAEHRAQAAALKARREREMLVAEMGARRGGAGGGGDADAAASDLLLRERGSLQSSHSAIDTILRQAAATQDALQRQRSSLSGAAGRLGGIALRLPGVGTLMTAINSRRRRNDAIVALVIALCLCFTIWFMFLR